MVFCGKFGCENHFNTKLSHRNLREGTHKGKFECPLKRILAPFFPGFLGIDYQPAACALFVRQQNNNRVLCLLLQRLRKHNLQYDENPFSDLQRRWIMHKSWDFYEIKSFKYNCSFSVTTYSLKSPLYFAILQHKLWNYFKRVYVPYLYTFHGYDKSKFINKTCRQRVLFVAWLTKGIISRRPIVRYKGKTSCLLLHPDVSGWTRDDRCMQILKDEEEVHRMQTMTSHLICSFESGKFERASFAVGNCLSKSTRVLCLPL